ncbi:dynactin 150 kDa subunit [Cavenderia fasciculata]|uniref:Dynactin 150 kDa subunit n=1 Tax=Cavenderia fasciculata TaxID=261658 RepID=F4PLR7_CACFS|nr:dynactin 150 kDa subunit [Cavenderia fasciculata]EGG23489.1 dynactin 150 kDa subunit [Cavenderia fasciculata]|eukprot:XP_004361340.1 dynactin 150 kDa subunit [Cavenderia fasciculata]
MDEGRALPVGSRVQIKDKPELGTGTIKYVGMAKFQTGRWVGIELDTSVGRNDGTVQGEKYFDCRAAHGIFVKPNMVIVIETPSSSSSSLSDDIPLTISDLSSSMPPPSSSTPSSMLPPSSTSPLSSSTGLPSTSTSKPSGIRPPSSLGKRPSITPTTTTTTGASSAAAGSGIRPPSSLGKRPSVTPTTTNTTATTTTTTATDSGLKKPTSVSSKPSSSSPASTSPPATSTSPVPPVTAAVVAPAPAVPATPTPAPTPVVAEKEVSPVTTTTTTTTTPAPAAATTKESKIARPSGLKPPTTTTTPTPTPVVTEVEKPKPVITTTPTAAAPTPKEDQSPLSPSSDKKVQKVVQGEDDDEDSGDEVAAPVIATPLSPPKQSVQQQQQQQQINENVEKMMLAINELTEYKTKAQEQISEAQNTIKELKSEKEKAIREYEKQIQQIEKTLKDKEKEYESSVKHQQKHDESIEKQLSRVQVEWEKEKKELLEQISTINENVEMLTLDKEFAEEKVELAEGELEVVKEELELLKSQVEAQELERSAALESTDSGDALTSESAAVLKAQIEKLKETLVKLRDVTVNEKHENAKKFKEMEAMSRQLSTTIEKANKLESVLAQRSEEVEELKQALDDAQISDDLVADLSEKNIELNEKVVELTTTIADLEDMRDLASELEENQAAVEKALRSELHLKEVECLNMNGQLANSQLKTQEGDRTITQFRELVGRLQNRLEEMRRKEEEHAEQSNLWTMIQREMESKNIKLQHQVTKATSMEIDHQLEKSRGKEAESHLLIVSEFLPMESFSADNDAIRLLLLLKRIILKSELIQGYLYKTYKVEEILNLQQQEDVSQDDKQKHITLVKHSLAIIHLLDKLSITTTWLQETMQRCSVDAWMRAGRSIRDLEQQERVIDALLQLIKSEQYGASYPSTDLERIITKLETLLNNVFGDKIYKSEWSILLQFMLNIQYYMNQLMLTDIIMGAGSSSATTFLPHARMTSVVHVCRKVIKNLMCQPLLRTSSIVHDVMRQSQETLSTMFVQLNNGLVSVKDDPSHLQGIIAGIDQRARQLVADGDAAAANNAIGIDDFSDSQEEGSMTAVEKVFNRMDKQLGDIVETILAGDLQLSDKEKSDVLAAPHPWTIRAAQLKQALNEVGQLRDSLSGKDAEMLEFVKQLRAREADLLEEKRKEEALDKRIKTLLKNENDLTESLAKETQQRAETETTYKQAIVKLQKDRSNFENELKQLQIRYITLEKESSKKISQSSSAAAAAAQLSGIEIRQDNIETICLRKAIRHLRNENQRLKGLRSLQELSRLGIYDPLKPTTLLNQNNVQMNETDGGKEGGNKSMSLTTGKHIKFNEIVDYSKQVDSCIGELLETIVAPKVIDLAKGSKNNLQLLEEIEVKKQSLRHKFVQVKQLENKMTSLINQSINSSIPPAASPTSHHHHHHHQFGKLADSFVSTRVKSNIRNHRIGSITLPTTSTTTTIDSASSSSTSIANITPSSHSSLLFDKEIQKALSIDSSSITSIPLPVNLNGYKSFKDIHSIFAN